MIGIWGRDKEEIEMKLGLALSFAFISLLLAGITHAFGEPCADKTTYGHCSTANPGNYCTGTPSALQFYVALCKCEAVPGWVQQGSGDSASCVQAKCPDGSSNGQCSITKPKMCVNGALADNSTKCGCPSGKTQSANGVTCDFIPCTDSGVSVPEGQCSPQTRGKICSGGQLVDKASSCPCKSPAVPQGEVCVLFCTGDDGAKTKSGDCAASKPQECTVSQTGVGVLVDNAAKCGCPDGKAADGIRCVAKATGVTGGSADLLGANSSSNQSGSQAGAGALSCPCCPAAVIGLLMIGFVAYRKQND